MKIFGYITLVQWSLVAIYAAYVMAIRLFSIKNDFYKRDGSRVWYWCIDVSIFFFYFTFAIRTAYFLFHDHGTVSTGLFLLNELGLLFAIPGLFAFYSNRLYNYIPRWCIRIDKFFERQQLKKMIHDGIF